MQRPKDVISVKRVVVLAMSREALNYSTIIFPYEEAFRSVEFLRKAKLELNETDENKERCLKDLRGYIAVENDLEADIDEKFLLRFLRVRKFDSSRAFNLLKNFYLHRAKYPDLYKDFKPSSIAHFLSTNICGYLPNRNAAGCAINVTRYGLLDTALYSFEDFHRGTLMSLGKIVESEITQICGLVVIIDLTGFSLKHLVQITPGRMYRFFTAIQDCFPIRLKELHIINYPKIFFIAYSIAKPFFSEKLKKRIVFHGSDLESLYRYFDRSILPEEFGGELGPFDNSKFTKMLLESEETFVKNQRFGFGTNQRKLRC